MVGWVGRECLSPYCPAWIPKVPVPFSSRPAEWNTCPPLVPIEGQAFWFQSFQSSRGDSLFVGTTRVAMGGGELDNVCPSLVLNTVQAFRALKCLSLSMTLRQVLRSVAPGLMPRAVLEKFATLQLLDVSVPTIDDHELRMVRRTEPDRDLALLLARLGSTLPPQPPPKISLPTPTPM